MARSVTVGVDGSQESLSAVEWAAGEAVVRRQALRVVHVWSAAPGPHASPQTADGRRALGQSVLREAVRRAEARFPGLDVRAEQQPGPAADVLLAAARDADLLVLGSRGLGAVAGFLVGSVALSVVAAAPCPVALVRADSPAPDGSDPRDVVLGVDLDHGTDALFAYAFEAARLRDCGLTVVHAYPVPAPYGIAPGESLAATMPDLFAERYERLLDALGPWRGKNPDIDVRPVAEPGHAAPAVLEAARGASLCVIGRRVRARGPGPHLGAVDHGVLHHATCPVVVVPHA
ncbi:universal stress protein [Streptomyces sp. NPDC047002]|uniref:universal stress protein n=1 Tax=Streptomyces sp. NPDC047002 TaxID=3155475 RepID=UPI003452462F